MGIRFSFEFRDFHPRSIITDTGWKINLDRGLDIFQSFDFKNPFNLANTMQEYRQSRGTTISYIRVEDEEVIG